MQNDIKQPQRDRKQLQRELNNHKEMQNDH